MIDEPGRAAQPDFLGRKEREHDRPTIGCLRQRVAETLCREQHGHRSGSVVIGAVVDGSHIRSHGARAAVAQVIVVSAENDDVLSEFAAARQNAGKVRGRHVGVLHRDASIDRDRESARARLQIGVDVFLKLREIDPLLRH